MNAPTSKQQALDVLSASVDAGINFLTQAQIASAVLKQEHAEGWPDGDPRWAQAWADADVAFKAARARLG
jgi:hypothetical protein